MHPHLRILVFVSILGLITSGMLVGMDLLTRDRIAENQVFSLYSAVLSSNEHAHTTANFRDVFEENIVETEIEGITFFEDINSGNVSFIVEGGGVWGPIIALITLESDLRTIVTIKILYQEETPGLGGVIADPQYLEKYEGVVLNLEDPENGINITHNKTGADNEVDAITGGTRTSNSFETIFNSGYVEALELWLNQGGGN